MLKFLTAGDVMIPILHHHTKFCWNLSNCSGKHIAKFWYQTGFWHGPSFHNPVGVTTSHQCYGSCTGCQSVSVLGSRSRDSYISRLLERLPRTSQTTVAFYRTLVVAHCAPIPMTRGSCSCREHITNSVTGVSRPPVLDCGTTFHPDYGGRDLPSTPSDDLSHLFGDQSA